MIARQDQPPTRVWLIGDGLLEAVCHHAGQKVVVGTVHPGDTVGDIPLLAGAQSPVTVRATTVVDAQSFDAAAFRALLRRKPVIARCWLRLVARRQLAVQARVVDTARGGSAHSRVARVLLREAEAGVVQCTQADMGAMTGIRRPTVNRVLRQFDQAGLIRRGYRSIDLLSPQRLSRVADGARLPPVRAT